MPEREAGPRIYVSLLKHVCGLNIRYRRVRIVIIRLAFISLVSIK
jgi:hypothetical protein